MSSRGSSPHRDPLQYCSQSLDGSPLSFYRMYPSFSGVFPGDGSPTLSFYALDAALTSGYDTSSAFCNDNSDPFDSQLTSTTTLSALNLEQPQQPAIRFPPPSLSTAAAVLPLQETSASKRHLQVSSRNSIKNTTPARQRSRSEGPADPRIGFSRKSKSSKNRVASTNVPGRQGPQGVSLDQKAHQLGIGASKDHRTQPSMFIRADVGLKNSFGNKMSADAHVAAIKADKSQHISTQPQQGHQLTTGPSATIVGPSVPKVTPIATISSGPANVSVQGTAPETITARVTVPPYTTKKNGTNPEHNKVSVPSGQNLTAKMEPSSISVPSVPSSDYSTPPIANPTASKVKKDHSRSSHLRQQQQQQQQQQKQPSNVPISVAKAANTPTSISTSSVRPNISNYGTTSNAVVTDAAASGSAGPSYASSQAQVPLTQSKILSFGVGSRDNEPDIAGKQRELFAYLDSILGMHVDLTNPDNISPAQLQLLVFLTSRVLRRPVRGGRSNTCYQPFLLMHIHMLRDLWLKSSCNTASGIATVAGISFSWSAFREALRRLTHDFTAKPPVSLHAARPLATPSAQQDLTGASYLRLLPVLAPLGSTPMEVSKRFWDVCISLPRSFRQLDPLLPSARDVLGILANDMHPWFSRCGVAVPLPWKDFFLVKPSPTDQDPAATCMAMIFFSFICARAFCMDATLLIDVNKHEIIKRREAVPHSSIPPPPPPPSSTASSSLAAGNSSNNGIRHNNVQMTHQNMFVGAVGNTNPGANVVAPPQMPGIPIENSSNVIGNGVVVMPPPEKMNRIVPQLGSPMPGPTPSPLPIPLSGNVPSSSYVRATDSPIYNGGFIPNGSPGFAPLGLASSPGFGGLLNH